jgi:hypothetical protein
MTAVNCTYCQNEVPLEWQHCPHCCHGQYFPNVRLAGDATEREALNARYNAARADAEARGVLDRVNNFESEVLAATLVIATSMAKLSAIANRERDLFATYYDLMELKFAVGHGGGPIDFRRRRPQAEIELLGSERLIRKLHYGCLSIDGKSLEHYGQCTIHVSPRMIQHRASLYSENTAVAYDRDHHFPPGHRAVWEDRGRLCVAKLASRISNSTATDDFKKILMKNGTNAISDEFVEVQILGELTIRAFLCVEIRTTQHSKPAAPTRPRSRRGTKDMQVIRNYCENNGVECRVL